MTTTTTTRVLFFLLASTACFSPSLGGGDTLIPSQSLADDDAGGATVISVGSRFALGFFSPAGSTDRYVGVWYHNISQQTVAWVANRDRPIAGRSGRFSLTPNGTLVITDAVAQNNSPPTVWSSGPPAVAVANPVARLLDDGNLVVSEAGGGGSTTAWESFDFPTDTILPGMKVGVNLTTGLNRNITSWQSASDPSPGEYVSSYDMDGDPQLYLWSGAQKYWRGGPWNGFVFSGLPEMKVDILRYDVVIDSAHRALSYSYRVLDASMLSRFTMTSQGTLQHLLWIDDQKSWMVYGFTPRDECDTISPCGPNGLCYPNRDTITCACVQGFSPKSGSIKDLRDWANGCRRRTPLDCRNGTDGFVKQGNVKLPDTSGATVDWRQSVSLDQCRASCHGNCSCTAFASANLSTGGAGSGCVMWTSDLADLRTFDSEIGQDLYIRVAAADLVEGEQGSRRSHLAAIVAPSLAALLLLVACGICWARRRKKTNNRRQDNVDEEKEVKGMDLPVYDLAAVVDATNNFSMDNKLGQGGFGPVYKGVLEDGKEIAVKRLSKTSVQGVEEFKNEVMLIAKLQHRNLVRLFGCCIQGGERMLIYEYMPNGSLDSLLFYETRKTLLKWPVRYNIITGIARGLLYLHQDSRFRIIHRDLKAGNILLDGDMSPKISDFGMARIFGGDDIEVNTRKVVGTYGYMSPEYAMDGIFSVKSDVFSFGVLVLEIVTGKKNRGLYHSSTNHLNLVGQVWSLWKEGKPLEAVDKSIRHSLHMVEVLSCIKVGLLCVQERPNDRPKMSSVVKLLGNDSAQLPEPKQPGFIASKGTRIEETDSSTSKYDSTSSKDNITLTVLEGR